MFIPYHRPFITDDEVGAAAETIRNGWLTMGQKTIDFEQRFAERLGAQHAVAVNSGTAALHLALCALELTSDDEVIVPSTTFVATAEVVRYFGAKVVMADIEKGTHCIDVSKLESLITRKTRAVIPVHFGGQPCDMDEILSLARAKGIAVIEDAAHAFPAFYKDRAVGTIGDITCFSFYVTKTLAAGEGGMALTANEEWASKMKRLRLHGITKDAWKRYTKDGSWEYDVTEAGFKYNTTDINSSIAIEQLKKADFLNAARLKLVEAYDEGFKGNGHIIPYELKTDRRSAHHLYPLRLNLDSLSIDRAAFIKELAARDIMTSVHFIPMYRFTYYKELGYNAQDFPQSEWVFERTLSLPLFPGMTDEETAYVIENVNGICGRFAR
jgi:perosamine synthetase